MSAHAWGVTTAQQDKESTGTIPAQQHFPARQQGEQKGKGIFPLPSCFVLPCEGKGSLQGWGKKESPGDVKGRKADEAGCSHDHTVFLKYWILRAPSYEFTARGQEGGISAFCWVGAAASRLMTEPKQKKDVKLEQILFLSLSPAAQVISVLPAMEGIPLVPVRDIRVNLGPQTRPKTWQ